MIKTNELFDLTNTLAAEYLSRFEYPWQALAGIKEEIIRIGNSLDENEYRLAGERGRRGIELSAARV